MDEPKLTAEGLASCIQALMRLFSPDYLFSMVEVDTPTEADANALMMELNRISRFNKCTKRIWKSNVSNIWWVEVVK